MIYPSAQPRRRRLDTIFAAGLLVFAGYRLIGGTVLSDLLAAQGALVAVLLVIRRAPLQEASLPIRLLAWWSAYAPLLMRPGLDAVAPIFIQAGGLLLALWAKACLGRSFGIAPADRGLVIGGPYRWLRHPVYAGELVSFGGVWLSAPGAWNAGLLTLITLSLLLRIRAEERVIGGYGDYAAQVHWRLVPGIW